MKNNQNNICSPSGFEPDTFLLQGRRNIPPAHHCSLWMI